jgi:transcriptional regulator with XRE-family HTH domain
MTFGQRMCELMTERGISLRKLAKAVPCDSGHLSKIARDLKPPSTSLAARIDTALDANGELAATAPQPNVKRRPAQQHPPQQDALPVGTVDQSPTPDQGDDDVKRRAALRLISALGAGATIPPGTVETLLAGVEDALGNDHLDLAEWEHAVADYDYRLNTSPAGSLIVDLAADIIAMDAVFTRQLPPLQRAGLLRVSAALSGLLAIELGDAGDQRAARIAWGTATRAADASGDLPLQVWVRGRAAEDALFTGRSPQVITDLANEAAAMAGERSSPGLARAHAARTYLAAKRGDDKTTSAALADLHRTFERLPETAEAQSVFGFRETQYRWAESFAYVHTGDDRAAAALTSARTLYPAAALAPRANLDLMEAMAQVHGRDIDSGLQQALETLQGHTRGSSGGHLLTTSILTALPDTARTLPAARELHTLSTISTQRARLV